MSLKLVNGLILQNKPVLPWWLILTIQLSATTALHRFVNLFYGMLSKRHTVYQQSNRLIWHSQHWVGGGRVDRQPYKIWFSFSVRAFTTNLVVIFNLSSNMQGQMNKVKPLHRYSKCRRTAWFCPFPSLIKLSHNTQKHKVRSFIDGIIGRTVIDYNFMARNMFWLQSCSELQLNATSGHRAVLHNTELSIYVQH